MPIRILGIDPGFANLGWALVEVDGTAKKVLSMSVVCTEPSAAKRKVLASDDNFRRARSLAKTLEAIVISNNVNVICAESMSFPRNASSAAKVAMVWGVFATICELHSIPLFMLSPKQLKSSVAGYSSASKEEVQRSLDILFDGSPLDRVQETGVPGGKREHAYDALAAVVACLDSEEVRLLLQAARGCTPCAVLTT